MNREYHIREAKRLLEQADDSHKQGATAWAQSAATLALAHFAAADHTPPERRLSHDELVRLFRQTGGFKK